MPIYVVTQDSINRVSETTFSQVGLHERRDLQRLLRENIEIIAPNVLVISEEFGEWEDSRRRIDLLGVDQDANLVVVELKRSEDGGHMELQAIRYASMVAEMTFDQAVSAYQDHLNEFDGEGKSASELLLKFLGWDEPDEDKFARDVKIILASAEFSKEITSSVLWLRDRDVDIRCIRMRPYTLDGKVLVDVQPIIPLPEAEDYQVRVRAKAQKERKAPTSSVDFTRFDVQIDGTIVNSMWKRNAIFFVCKHLCEKGIAPEEIANLIDWRPSRVWLSAEGSVTGEEFKKHASEKVPSFDERRWFASEDELLRINGRTYAFSSQWGGEGWHKAMKLLKEKYSKFNINYSPHVEA